MVRRVLKSTCVGVGLLLGAAGPLQAQTCNRAMVESTPTSRFIRDDAKQTVTDRKTGLMWAMCANGQWGKDCKFGSVALWQWRPALLIAADSTFAGYDDWRLPNAKELESLVEVKCAFPAMNLEVFPNAGDTEVGNAKFWSSSPVAGRDRFAWSVAFDRGVPSPDRSSSGLAGLRLVRGGM